MVKKIQRNVIKERSFTQKSLTGQQAFTFLAMVLAALVAIKVLVENQMTAGDKNNNESLDGRIGQMHVHAIETLHRMKERGAMNTKISDRDYVLSHGFLRDCNPCMLQCLFQMKQFHWQERQDFLGDEDDKDVGPLNIVVLGGSASARPGDNCTAKTEKGEVSGRYTDLLEERLLMNANLDTGRSHNSIPKFRIINRAQGAQVSTNNALLLDELLDPNATDVIFWEFALNDGSPLDHQRKLDFWLTRVKSFFAQAGKPPPPIVLIFLWEWYARQRLIKVGEDGTVDMNPMAFTGDLIDKHRANGWDISAINVGASVNRTAVTSNVKLMFDDTHHPSCEGVKLIADMLAHVLYSNLALPCALNSALQCSVDAAQQRPQPMFNPHQGLPGEDIPKECELLWKDLFYEDTVIGSISAVVPRLGNVSNLRAEKLDHIWSWPTMVTGEIDPGRQDRKLVLILPLCNENRNFNVTLLEPELKWLGLSPEQSTKAGLLLTINNVPIQLSSFLPSCKLDSLNEWVLIKSQVQKATKYTISLCKKATDNVPFFLHLVGVSVPH
jgi:hypothetical protein